MGTKICKFFCLHFLSAIFSFSPFSISSPLRKPPHVQQHPVPHSQKPGLSSSYVSAMMSTA